MSSVQNPPAQFVSKNASNVSGRDLFSNGYYLDVDNNGYLGIFRPDGTELAYFTPDRFILVGQGGKNNFEFNLNGQSYPLFSGDPFIFTDVFGNLLLCSNVTVQLNGNHSGTAVFNTYTSYYNGHGTVGFGLSPIYGLDNRTGRTAVDASPITLYTTTAAGQVYKLKARINATAGTSPAATYTLKWIENGVVISQALSISALNSPASTDILIQPDSGTAITAQLTAISGTGTTVNVAAEVEQVA